MKNLKFEDLLREEIEDLYDAEKQIVEALPKMVDAATDGDLKAAFAEHLDQTKQQVTRLERVFQAMGEQPGGKQCDGMRGLLKEGEKMISELEKSSVLDAGLIGAAQKVEHYEISGYGTARTLAEFLGQQDAADLLQETLDEERATDETLTEIAETIMTGDSSDEEELEDEEEEEEEEVG